MKPTMIPRTLPQASLYESQHRTVTGDSGEGPDFVSDALANIEVPYVT
jgi:hypothetical protein